MAITATMPAIHQPVLLSRTSVVRMMVGHGVNLRDGVAPSHGSGTSVIRRSSAPTKAQGQARRSTRVAQASR
jgi:hypothetical protein